MSLRAYFITHAPAEPQEWFRPKMKTKRPTDPWISLDGQREYDNLGVAFSAENKIWLEKTDGGFIPPLDRLVTNKFKDECDVWDEEYKKQRAIQWPVAWADAQIAEIARVDDQIGESIVSKD